MIQSLDRETLAQEIDKRAQQHGLRMPVLIQVNIGQRASKGRRCRGKPDVLRTICCRFAWP